MTMDEARALVTQLNLVFDIVRFVDVRMMQEVAVKIAFQRKLLSIVDV